MPEPEGLVFLVYLVENGKITRGLYRLVITPEDKMWICTWRH